MDDLREKVNAALRIFHNSSCYPTPLDSDLHIGRELVFTAIHASGHRIVPVEPTEEMVEAGARVYWLRVYNPDGNCTWDVASPESKASARKFVRQIMLTAYGQGDKP